MAPELRTARLVLRPTEPADRSALHRLWTDPDVRRFLWDDRVIDLASVDGSIERSTASFAGEGFGLFALREASGAELLGAVGIHRLARPRCRFSRRSRRGGGRCGRRARRDDPRCGRCGLATLASREVP